MDFFEAGVQGEEGASENVLEKQSEIFSWPASRSRKSVQTRREDKNLFIFLLPRKPGQPSWQSGRETLLRAVFGWS